MVVFPLSPLSNKCLIGPINSYCQSLSVPGIFPRMLGSFLCVSVLCKPGRSQRAELIGRQEQFSEGQIDLNLIA